MHNSDSIEVRELKDELRHDELDVVTGGMGPLGFPYARVAAPQSPGIETINMTYGAIEWTYTQQ